jgi:putative DNA primase/helicase
VLRNYKCYTAGRGGENRDINRAGKIIVSEMSGVLNWAIEGLQLLLREGFDPLPKCHDRLYNETVSSIDPRSDFIDNYIAPNANSGETLKDVFQAWKDYAEGYGRKIGSDKSLKRAIMQYRPNAQFKNYHNRVYIEGIRLVRDIESVSRYDDIPF